MLTSPGGTVLAECRAAGAYLVSWSPAQGYEASDVTRGPAATARVVFESAAKSVTMTVILPGRPRRAARRLLVQPAPGAAATDE